ncbi:DUF2269 family protein [Pontibacillus litoralis]|uniref:DUF2269 domain-containing protein n=1 Tax=Pontibacillus litoralis JSM 072002 TaxID=1385512 RepID=A0A0A5G157_9BACI|nr:DUF2269 family protein [Pontibacillus litoralis]KGX84838.1 hypothetical protein N784_11720 [Pontibacillus litoralis JSM 072002]
MGLLVFVHVMAAIVGIGSVYCPLLLVRSDQALADLRVSLVLMRTLNRFPVVVGSVALFSGVLLVIFGDYGSIGQVWLLGSLFLYIVIYIIVVGLIRPKVRRLLFWVSHDDNKEVVRLPPAQQQWLDRLAYWYYVVACLATLLFFFMIVKP